MDGCGEKILSFSHTNLVAFKERTVEIIFPEFCYQKVFYRDRRFEVKAKKSRISRGVFEILKICRLSFTLEVL